MKRLLYLMLLIPSFLCAQQEINLQKAILEVSDSERKGAERLFQNNTLASFASANFDITYYRCEWQVDPAVNYIRGAITSRFTITNTTDTIVFDCSATLTVDSVLYHGSPISSQHTGAALKIQFPASLSAGNKDSVTVYYQGAPADPRSFYQGNHAGTPIIWTLSEPYGSKEWWPCKNDQADKADSIDVLITNPTGYIPSSNGIVVDQQVSGGYVTTHFKHRYPIASYLVALAVTNYQTFADTVMLNGKILNLLGYFYPEFYKDFVANEYYTKPALTLFTEKFGEYPFINEKYGHTEFGVRGGMEHQTNSFIGATMHSLTAHELGHQWFGDKVTCGSWADIWLNEGFATYAQYLFTEVYFSSYRYSDLAGMTRTITSAPGGSVYVTDTSTVGRIFSNRLSYNKGFYVLYMIRGILGDSLFYQAIREYLNDPALSYKTARTADLQRHFEQASGRSFASFFKKWVYGEGYPNYTAYWNQNNNNWARVNLYQSTSHPSVNFYEMSVTLVFSNATQNKTFVVDHQFSGQEFWLDVGFAADTVLIDPQFWILAKRRISVKQPIGSSRVDEINVYPNPSPGNTFVSLKNPTGKSLSIQLYNTLGQIIFRKEVVTPGRDELISIPFNQFARGHYLLRIRNDKGMNMIRKVIF